MQKQLVDMRIGTSFTELLSSTLAVISAIIIILIGIQYSRVQLARRPARWGRTGDYPTIPRVHILDEEVETGWAAVLI